MNINYLNFERRLEENNMKVLLLLTLTLSTIAVAGTTFENRVDSVHPNQTVTFESPEYNDRNLLGLTAQESLSSNSGQTALDRANGLCKFLGYSQALLVTTVGLTDNSVWSQSKQGRLEELIFLSAEDNSSQLVIDKFGYVRNGTGFKGAEAIQTLKCKL